MPPPVVALTRPAASPTASILGPYVRAMGASGRTLQRGDSGAPPGPCASMPHRAATRAASRSNGPVAGPSHIRPTRACGPEGRATGTVQANPPGATSRPKRTSTSPRRPAGSSSCADWR